MTTEEEELVRLIRVSVPRDIGRLGSPLFSDNPEPDAEEVADTLRPASWYCRDLIRDAGGDCSSQYRLTLPKRLLTSFIKDESGMVGSAISLLLLGGLGRPVAWFNNEPVLPGDTMRELRPLLKL